MLCFQCREIRHNAGGSCPECGSTLVTPSIERLQRFVSLVKVRVVRDAIDAWQAQEVVDAITAERLRFELDESERLKQASANEEKRREKEARQEEARRTREEAEARQTEQREEAARMAVLAAPATQDFEPKVLETEHEPTRDESHDGLAALVALEQGGGIDKAVLYERVGWLIGFMLVLAGSIYGVREAWLALDETGRDLTIGGAFFAYHAAFIGMGALIARKGPRAGRVLSAIGTSLLPVAAVAFMHLLADNWRVGLLAGSVFLAASYGMTRIVARRFALTFPHTLSLVVTVPLTGILALAIAPGDAAIRFCLPIAALALFWFATRRALTEEPEASGILVVPFFAGYFAVALELMALTSIAPDDNTFSLTWRTAGTTFAAWLALWLCALSWTAFSLSTHGKLQALLPKWSAPTSVAAVALTLAANVAMVTTLLDPDDVPMRAALLIGATAAAVSVATSFQAAQWSLWIILLGMPQVALMAALLARAVEPENAALWPGFSACVVAAFVPTMLSSFKDQVKLAVRIEILILTGVLFVLCISSATSIAIPYIAGAGIVAIWMLSGEREHESWHYAAALFAASAIVVRTTGPVHMAVALFLAAAMFGGWPLRMSSARAGSARQDIAWLLLMLVALPVMQSSDRATVLAGLVASGALLILTVRDRSVFTTSGAWALLTVSVFAWRAPQSVAQIGVTLTALGTALALISASLRNRTEIPDTIARRAVGDRAPLPWSRLHRYAIADSAAAASFMLTVFGLLATTLWLADRREWDRDTATLAAVFAIVTCVLAFATFAWRGTFATLVAAGAAISVAAISHRIGHPLPPHVVGRNLTLIGLALCGVAALTQRFSLPLAVWLERPSAAKTYHWAPHGGVIALTTLLLYDAWHTGAPTMLRALAVVPPLMCLGPAIMLALIQRSLKQPALAYLTTLCLIPTVALIATQRGLMGPEMFPIDPAVGPFVPPGVDAISWMSAPAYLPDALTPRQFFAPALIAVSVLASVFTVALSFTSDKLREPRFTWLASSVTLCALTVFTASLGASSALAAWIVLGACVLGSFRTRYLRATLPLAAMGVVHAQAQALEVFPLWSGPAMGAISLFVLVPLLRRRETHETPRLIGIEMLVLLTSAAAIAYALAAGGASGLSTPMISEAQAVLAAVVSAGDLPLQSYALPLTLLLIAGTAQGIARLGLEPRSGAWGFLGVAGVTLFAVLTLLWRIKVGVGPRDFDLVAGTQTPFALGAALGIAHVLTSLDMRARPNLFRGERAARTAVIAAIAIAILLELSDLGTARANHAFLEAGLAAIGVVFFVTAHAAIRERSPFALDVAQTSIVGAYAFVRSVAITEVSPRTDAIFTMGLGFLLVGATILARRSNLPPLAASLKRFSAVLPLALPFVVSPQEDFDAAFAGAGAAVLYGVLGWVENSRFLGTLGAACANLTLVLLALSQGARGVEVYCAPLGLLMIMTAHIYGNTIQHDTRVKIRFIGTALIYVPSAAAIVWQVGDARDPIYALGFAGACLFAVGLGMLLHIRAYLFMGLGFLALDLVSLIVRAAQGSRAVGFVVLSLAGLSILATMVVLTLKRAEISAFVVKIRHRLRTWD
jgi:hypothetical protein